MPSEPAMYLAPSPGHFAASYLEAAPLEKLTNFVTFADLWGKYREYAHRHRGRGLPAPELVDEICKLVPGSKSMRNGFGPIVAGVRWR